MSENEKYWLITLGWDVKQRTAFTPVEAAIGLDITERDYKVFYVDVNTGTVTKMIFTE